jgi:hypothetical protein
MNALMKVTCLYTAFVPFVVNCNMHISFSTFQLFLLPLFGNFSLHQRLPGVREE